jgi:hypothetical protein
VVQEQPQATEQVAISAPPAPASRPASNGCEPIISLLEQCNWLTLSGISKSDWEFVDYIISRESGWKHDIWNTSGSGAYGLCQSLPANKMGIAGSDYMTNPITQLKWCNSYAEQRYGGWSQAKIFWENNHWW